VLSVAIVLLLAVPGPQGTVGAIVGGTSYPLYLNHWIGGFVGDAIVKRLGLGYHDLELFIATPFDICLATAMYWIIDRRLHTLRARLFTRGRGVAAMVIGYSLIAVGIACYAVLSTTTGRTSTSGPTASTGRRPSHSRSRLMRSLFQPPRAVPRATMMRSRRGLPVTSGGVAGVYGGRRVVGQRTGLRQFSGAGRSPLAPDERLRVRSRPSPFSRDCGLNPSSISQVFHSLVPRLGLCSSGWIPANQPGCAVSLVADPAPSSASRSRRR
jgi:hypothetical protein